MRFSSEVKKFINRFCRLGDEFPHIDANVLIVHSMSHLHKAMAWQNAPIIEGDHLHDFQYLEDLNDRRLRDAEVIASACSNGAPRILLEIGTSHGRTTALMSRNAPQGTIHTVNIPPEDILDGGRYVTLSLSREQIGAYHRQQGCTNVHQIYANTRDWEPDFGPIDVAFIDGCHDAEFVYNDTRKILNECRPGSLILWHDFAPELAKVYSWIGDVCRGVDRLYAEGLLSGKILHLQDSWVGLYKIPEDSE